LINGLNHKLLVSAYEFSQQIAEKRVNRNRGKKLVYCKRRSFGRQFMGKYFIL